MAKFVLVGICFILAFISLTVKATEVLELALHSTASCSSSSVAVPMALANSCWNLFGNFSLKFVCDGNRLQFWGTSADCTRAPDLDQPITCTDSTTVGVPANGLSCKTYPDADVVIMKVGAACDGVATAPGLQDFGFSFLQVINECLDTPAGATLFGNTGIPAGKYKVTISGNMVTYQQWSGNQCSGTPAVTYTGELGKCTTVTGSGGSGRRLAGSAVIFEKPGGSTSTSPSDAAFSSVSFSALMFFGLAFLQLIA